ncbi:hypothetical protein MPH_07653 [Macrophomina phaseolina MS6]|uniref:Nephrocystin 3-like N-terminal domain-containing protein n=1 Tax=Macrophomina phaseolina (strain MS6) TaxID=1126212 RepID=K2QZ01_MACPH|nr:hypothetical protein MPH_07653 [Macrophomina phaseolina MS6]
MDPVSSLSLACTVIQLVELSSKIVIGAADLLPGWGEPGRRGAPRCKSPFADAFGTLLAYVKVTASVLRYSSAVRSTSSTGEPDIELSDIADKAERVAVELAALLKTLELPKDAGNRTWKAVRLTMKGMCKRGKMKSLEGRLHGLQGLLNTWMIRSIREETSAVSKQMAELVRRQETLGAETTRSFEQMRQVLLEIRVLAMQSKDETRRKETDDKSRAVPQHEAVPGGLSGIFGSVRHFFSGMTSASDESTGPLKDTRTAAVGDEMRVWPEILKHLSFVSEEAKLVSKGQQLFRSLYDPDLILRYISVVEEYPDTFRWIFEDSTHGFKSWLEFDNGTYWISGKPGAGKSTLMKFVCEHKQTDVLLRNWAGPHELLIIKHFFWISGTELQRSEEGLLRSLLFQLLRR